MHVKNLCDHPEYYGVAYSVSIPALSWWVFCRPHRILRLPQSLAAFYGWRYRSSKVKQLFLVRKEQTHDTTWALTSESVPLAGLLVPKIFAVRICTR